MRRAAAAVGVSLLGFAAGVATLGLARAEPGYWFAGDSRPAAVALLAAGWSLIGCGAVAWARRPQSRFGALLVAAGFAWFLLEWNNPGTGSPAAFTAALCLSAACPPLVAHAVLAAPPGRGSRRDAVALGLAYVAFVLGVGIVPTLLFDPAASGCSQCPRNLVLVAHRLEVAQDVSRVSLVVGLVAAATLTALVAGRLARASAPPRRLFLAAGAGYLALVSLWVAFSLDDAALGNGRWESRLWLLQAAALVAVAAATAWAWERQRRARRAVARLVVDLAEAPPTGGLRDVLAATLGDPSLVLAYPLEGTSRLVDAEGRTVMLPVSSARTTLVEDDRPVAVLAHAPGLLDDEQLVREATDAARLALEHERLHAQVRARLEELRRSRARIVAAGDAERRRLERDLHDGAQQRLVGLSLTLGLVRARLRAGEPAAATLGSADAELRAAVEELRGVAHGIFPAVLADEGLAAAVEALAEESPVPLAPVDVPDARFDPAVETAAYTVVAEVVRTATAGVAVVARTVGGALVVEVETGPSLRADMVGLTDRVGALGGRLAVTRRRSGRMQVRAELPSGRPAALSSRAGAA